MKYIFRISGHQIPTEIQQLLWQEKLHRPRSWKALESYTLVLWVKQFCGAGNSLKISINVKQQVSHPTHLDPRSPDNGEINKINLHTGKIDTGRKKWTGLRFQINLVKIFTAEGHQILQQIIKLKYSKHKTKSHDQHFVLYLPSPAHRSNINFAGLKVHPTVLKSTLPPGLQTSSTPKTRFNTSKIKHPTGAESRGT